MTHFQAKQTRILTELGKDLVDVYNNTLGSSGPYANPASLQAVIDRLLSPEYGWGIGGEFPNNSEIFDDG
jgi:hypothetical protein